MTTTIEWTDTVWNPIVGCSRVSAGCEHCYAERVAHRGMSPQHRGLTVLGKKGPRWTGEVRFLADRLAEPLSWRKPRRVFVNSMSDLFHEGVTFDQIAAVFGVMAAAPQHTFQVLTKRPERARDFFGWMREQIEIDGSAWTTCLREAVCQLTGPARIDRIIEDGIARDGAPGAEPWPLPNVWLGVSVEDQRTADERIPLLLETPSAIRWVSYEPALGPVHFREEWLRGRFDHCPEDEGDAGGCEGCPGSNAVGYVGDCHAVRGPRLSWVVVGGESGPGARPFDLAWARSVIEQGRAAGVPVFVKQLGARPFQRGPSQSSASESPGSDAWPLELVDRKGGDPAEWPEVVRVREWPEVRRGA